MDFLINLSNNDEAFIREMVHSFIEASDEFIRKSDNYITNVQYDKLANATHKYIPGVSFLGMKGLENQLLHFEEQNKTQTELSLVKDSYAVIRNLIDETIIALKIDFNIIS